MIPIPTLGMVPPMGAATPVNAPAAPNWFTYSNQNAIRNDPVAPELLAAMSFLPELGVRMDIISGGQGPAGSGDARIGYTRHDNGNAADVDFYIGDTKLSWHNPDHLPILVEIVRRARANGITGIGAGDDYMGVGRFHIGFGAPAVWGANGRSANAMDWLRAAYYGAEAGPVPTLTGGGGMTNSTDPMAPFQFNPPPQQQPLNPQSDWRNTASSFSQAAQGQPFNLATAYDPAAIAAMFALR